MCSLFLLGGYSQNSNTEATINEVLLRETLWFPMTSLEWSQNKNSYLGYYIQLNFEHGRVAGLDFSDDTPPKVVENNGELLSKINSSITKNGLAGLQDGLHVFPIVCEMVPIPKMELQNNLEPELKKTIPDSDDVGEERVIVHQPMLVKIYPPKR
ncbi:hypothetical protein J0A68_01740 [Algoriphagus sp. H41]|uniref:TonB protein C-terminal n=1 Tax=Algoriphagus oliviformis TaxID=2811231 RepID=A0ABS3BXS9_9BACT|nr:hypothetical protein [Algoriphagus oliviformis]MBN7809659.1 hypothetical protein [Algoriphagus oliviformis]